MLLFKHIDIGIGIKVHICQGIADHPRWSFLYKRRETVRSADRHRLLGDVLLLISSQVRHIFNL